MLWAIDVGNTHTVFGIWDGSQWIATWRITTSHLGTEDEIAGHLLTLCNASGIRLSASGCAIASVNPFVNENLERFATEWLKVEPRFLRTGADAGIKVQYEPVTAVGADRIANAVGALALVRPPIVVVDFGTATTLDAIDQEGTYIGGAILPGPETLMDSLTTKTAKLPKVELKIPTKVIGGTTAQSLQSGIVLSYVMGIEGVLKRFEQELGGSVAVLSTGGLGALMAELCPALKRYEANLTLDGLRLFFERTSQA